MSRLDSVAKMLVASAVFRPAADPPEEDGPVLPQVAAAREDYRPSKAEQVEARAWGRRGRR